MKCIKINSSKGYTLIELIVVMGIFFMLVGGGLISTGQVVNYQNTLEVEGCKNNILVFINKSRLYCRNKSRGGEILFDTINNEIRFKMGTSILDRISMPRGFKLKDINPASGKNYISIDKEGFTKDACTIWFLDKFKDSDNRLTICSGTWYLEIKKKEDLP